MQLRLTLGHETTIGNGSVINPGTNISGGVKIGGGVLAGTGVQVLQYRTVHDGATVGAGPVVTHDVAAGDTLEGIPAGPVVRRVNYENADTTRHV